MLFDVLFSQVEWTPYGLQCQDAETAKKLHSFLREAILDRHVYVSKIISFTFDISNPINAGSNRSVGRNINVGESFTDIIINLQDKVFIQTNATSARIDLEAKENTLLNAKFKDRSGDLNVLYTDPKVCRLVNGTGAMHVALAYDHGFRTMDKNSDDKPKSHFPCYTDFSIADYFRIPPMDKGSTLVPIRYYHNANSDALRSILYKWLVPDNRSNLEDEEKVWLQHYAL